MQALRYWKGVSKSTSRIMSWSRQKVTVSREGHNGSHIIDARQEDAKWFRMIQRIRGKCNYRRKTLEHIDDTTGSLVALGSMGSVVMMMWKRSNGRKKWMAQTQEGQKCKEGCSNLTRRKKCPVQEWATDTTNRFPNFPPTISGRYPNYFLITSLKGILYACTVSSSFRRI